MILEEEQRLLTEDEEKKRAKLDGAWKEAIRKYFKDFTQLCWPDIFDKIDWTQDRTFLEQEFHPILKQRKIGKKITDKLIQICLKNNTTIGVRKRGHP